MTAARFDCPRCHTSFVKNTDAEAAFVECPSCGAMALPTNDATDALSRKLSGVHDKPARADHDDDALETTDPPMLTSAMAKTEITDPVALANARTASGDKRDDDAAPDGFDAASTRIDVAQHEQAPAPHAQDAQAQDDDALQRPAGKEAFDFDFSAEIDLDLTAKEVRSTPIKTRREAPTAKSRRPKTQPRTSPRSEMVEADGAPPPLAPEASSPFSRAPDGETATQKAWQGLSEDAFNDLEKAFDAMAIAPTPHKTPKLPGQLSPKERAFLGESASPPPLRNDGPTHRKTTPAKPPPRQKTQAKEPRPGHLTLRPDTESLACLPLNEAPPERPARPRQLQAEAPAPKPQRAQVAAPADESTDLVPKDGPHRDPPRTVPSPWRGFTAGRIAAAVVVAALLGGAAGFFATPAPERPNTKRAQAELILADGNRFYAEGRFDDALGAFKSAILTDESWAVPHRAKGAALAKLQRHDEAAQAYEKYLALEPNAVDTADARESIAHRAPPKTDGAAQP